MSREVGHLKPVQRELARYMQQLSKRHFAADWADALEFALWSFLTERGGRLHAEERYRLHQLTQRAGGWITLSNDALVFVPEEVWVVYFNSNSW